jgi:hypothetical protein
MAGCHSAQIGNEGGEAEGESEEANLLFKLGSPEPDYNVEACSANYGGNVSSLFEQLQAEGFNDHAGFDQHLTTDESRVLIHHRVHGVTPCLVGVTYVPTLDLLAQQRLFTQLKKGDD